jgi:hypothetical protein
MTITNNTAFFLLNEEGGVYSSTLQEIMKKFHNKAAQISLYSTREEADTAVVRFKLIDEINKFAETRLPSCTNEELKELVNNLPWLGKSKNKG